MRNCWFLCHLGFCNQCTESTCDSIEGSSEFPRVKNIRFSLQGDLILSDEMNHVSLILGMRLSGASYQTFAHNGTTKIDSIE